MLILALVSLGVYFYSPYTKERGKINCAVICGRHLRGTQKLINMTQIHKREKKSLGLFGSGL